MKRVLKARTGVLVALAALALSSCTETAFFAQTAKRFGGSAEEGNGYKVGKPYKIKGVWYYPHVDYEYRQTGIASWYGTQFHGKYTANGEVYDMNSLTAAHRTLPLPTFVRVTNLENGRSLILRVNDRGPFAHSRIIDVSRRGAQLLGFYRQGTARVRVEVMANESRALAARLTGRRRVAMGQTPIKVAKLPKASVSAENLAPPPGGATAPKASQEPSRQASLVPEPVNLEKPAAPAASHQVAATPPKLGVVTTVPVKTTRLYVQAGAFSYFDNANRVRARLYRLGNVRISPVLINGQDLYRVRIGPFQQTDQADRSLESVIRAGYTDARIVVE